MIKTSDCIIYVSNHPWLKRIYKRLNKNDIDFIISFLNKNFIDKNEAMFNCNRLFIGESDKPKNWKIIVEIISCCITHRY